MVLATDLFHMMDDPGGPSHVNFDEPVATFDARYVISGAAAPIGAEYVVISLDGDLTDERVLTGTVNQIAIADGGAGGNVTLSTPQDIHTAATPEFDGVIIGSADGIDYNPGADIDTDLISVGVTGNPLLKWDESENAFDFSTIISIPTTTSTVGQILQNGNRIFHTYGTDNIFLGEESGNFTTTGNANCGVGYHTLIDLTSGERNTAFGVFALANVTEGINNIGIGRSSGLKITTGDNNICIGSATGDDLIGGVSNTLLGTDSGGLMTSARNNVAIGNAAMASAIDPVGCIAIGNNALKNNNNDGNVAIGDLAMLNSTTAENCVSLGERAGFSCDGYGSVFIGFNAGYNEATGNKLYIANSDTATPLIYGVFDGAGGVGIKIHSPAAAAVALTVKGAISQSANLQEWQDSNGDIFSHVLAGGEQIQYKQTVAKVGAYTATVDDEVILCDASGGAFTITLLAASGNAGFNFHIKKTDDSINAVTIDGNAAETIDGDLTVDIAAQYESLHIVCDGSNWYVL